MITEIFNQKNFEETLLNMTEFNSDSILIIPLFSHEYEEGKFNEDYIELLELKNKYENLFKSEYNQKISLIKGTEEDRKIYGIHLSRYSIMKIIQIIEDIKSFEKIMGI